ncbi:MAG: N-acetylmuramoyl-L-alanine amidase [Flavobacteriales bacterium]|nr:N-acetylmuramoyl-L-alanine amidase [Flavobacteriales bacterium]
MVKFSLSFLAVLMLNFTTYCQQSIYPKNNYQAAFDAAYQQYPAIPKGMLEAVAFTTSRFQHLDNQIESCVGLPAAYGVMGLTLDGLGYFRNNLNYVSQLSGISVSDILINPAQNILAYAKAYNELLQFAKFDKTQVENHAEILVALSELPYDGIQNDFALNSHLYSVFNFLHDEVAQKTYHFPNHNISLERVFGEENLKVLSSSRIVMTENSVSTIDGKLYTNSNQTLKSVDYPPALTQLTPCNYNSRSLPISAVTVHTIQGTYSGAISWAANCVDANVSYHYCLRSSDGQVTQVVLESNRAWHVGSENDYTIGLEHEGFVNNPAWYTTAMYQSSADLSIDVTQSGYGISPLRTAYFPWAPTTNYNVTNTPGSCVKIKGHQHYPNQTHTDPGANWDWDYYYKLINNSTPITTNNNLSGTVTDLGGTGNYGNDQRSLFLIQPTGATSITLNINVFNVENNWDYLYIYNGTTPFSPRVGYYTGSSIPSTITVNSGNVLIEFRSDCATTAPGFEISWNAVAPDAIKPTTAITPIANPVNDDFTATFTDADNVGGSGILHQFYQVIDFDGTDWRANDNNGFFSDNFDVAIHPDWTTAVGTWSIAGGYLTQTDDTLTNTNIYAALNQNTFDKYLYHWEGKIEGTGTNRRAGFHIMCDDASQSNRGNSYFVWFRVDNNKIQIYKVVNDVFTLEQDVAYTFNAATWYDFKVTFDKTTGEIDVFVNDVFKASWQDPSAYTTGDYVSFRSGEAVYTVNNLKVYHNRANTALVTVGNDTLSDIRFEGTPAGKVKSLVIDNAKNISLLADQLVNVEWLSTSINQAENNVIRFYPNPATDVLFVEFDSPLSTNIIVRDVLNREVLVEKTNNSLKINIDISSLTKGVYFLEFENNQTKHSIKFIKQ